MLLWGLVLSCCGGCCYGVFSSFFRLLFLFDSSNLQDRCQDERGCGCYGDSKPPNVAVVARRMM